MADYCKSLPFSYSSYQNTVGPLLDYSFLDYYRNGMENNRYLWNSTINQDSREYDDLQTKGDNMLHLDFSHAGDNESAVAMTCESQPHCTHVYEKYKETIKPRKTRIRTFFTVEQRQALEKHFQDRQYLNSCQIQKIAKMQNLDYKTVKTWFQNRRTKLKKEQQARKWSLEKESDSLQIFQTVPICGNNNAWRRQIPEEYSNYSYNGDYLMAPFQWFQGTTGNPEVHPLLQNENCTEESMVYMPQITAPTLTVDQDQALERCFHSQGPVTPFQMNTFANRLGLDFETAFQTLPIFFENMTLSDGTSQPAYTPRTQVLRDNEPTPQDIPGHCMAELDCKVYQAEVNTACKTQLLGENDDFALYHFSIYHEQKSVAYLQPSSVHPYNDGGHLMDHFSF
ncbi:uncharacterized protein LOC122808684 isoform X2 [Protopterus annectens]|uniref:uncharacterized protein LOC122808684 isoform X2 n=1 Tax=Protopterus annectens TaxID=7888 RepID=UPI001CFB608B|nr:uncharacterized protein LOC122808684 isoform X2 [Protopterus annectens]